MSLTSYLGIDVGSVTTKVAIVDENGKYVDSYMLRTAGKPVLAVQEGLKHLKANATQEYNIQGVGTTGSGRNLAGALVGADIIKNEITAHAVAASINIPGVQTILEIGGQDSKIIILRDGNLYFIEAKSGKQYGINDIKGFKQLLNTKYNIAGQCIICCADDMYRISSQVYAFPIKCI